ncbi:MAG: tyrosine-type recombinase/integrase [Cyanobacteria bacterium P01_E01_bin.42]
MKIPELLKRRDGKFYKKGRVSFSKRKGSIRLRVVYNYNYYSLTIKGGITKKTLEAAEGLADIINGDLAFNRFDTTLHKYDPDREKRANIVKQNQEPNLRDIWESYKEAKKHQSALTTQKYQWREVDRLLELLPSEQLKLTELETLGQATLKIRALSTTHRNFQFLNAAITLCTGKNHKIKKQLPPEPKPPIEWFEVEEVKFILQAFKDNRYQPDKSRYEHRFYYPYVSFLAHTGCRPEEALALTWGDLTWNRDRTECKVLIDKAYSKGILMPHTKNYKIRKISLSPALIATLKEIEHKSYHKEGLVLRGRNGGFLDHSNFREDNWKPVLDGLVRNNLVRKYLRPYCLRHSYVTNMHYKHTTSLVKIAKQIGDKTETVIQRYTGLKEIDANVLDLY